METFHTLADLKEQLDYHNQLFWGENTSEISDSEYDLLKNRYDTLAAEHPNWEYSLDHKAAIVFGNKEELKKVPHFRPFYSLARTYDFNSFDDIKKRYDNDIYIESKLDGMAVELQYVYGKLDKVVTKGTVNEGEDITHQISYFKKLPKILLELKTIERFDIRAEAHLTFLDIDILKDSTNTPNFKQRNQVSGWLRSSLNNRHSVKGMITCSVYDIDPIVTDHLNINTGLALRNWFTEKGFDIPRLLTEKELLSQAPNKVEPFDGYLVKANKFTTRKALGDELKWCIAFKYNTLFGISRLKDVEWSVTKSRITPTLIYEPVVIDNSDCNRANAFNAGNILKLNIGPGDHIRIVMAGDIVPHLDSVTHRVESTRFKIPDVCPCCKGPVSLIGPTLTCNNTSDCSMQIVSNIVYALSPDGLDIKGIGFETINHWVGLGFIKNVLDVYRLELNQIGERYYNMINSNRKKTLSQFIYALNIEEIGPSSANELSKHCGTLEKFLAFTKDHEFIKANYSPAKAMHMLKVFTDKSKMSFIECLALALDIRSNNYIKGFKKIVLTGAFEAPRYTLAEQLLKSGIEVLPRVVKGVECVIAGYTENQTASTAKAIKMKIPVYYVNNEITINEIIRKING